jgi:hypothetical protein
MEKTMRRNICLLTVLAFLFGCHAVPEGFLAIDGWSAQGEAETYDADGLWELINGAADTFLSYGFESVTVQNFSSGEIVASVSAYDMGTPLNAFGIYRTEAPPGEGGLQVGTEAFVAPPYQCLLLKDRYYVKVDAYEGDIDGTTGKALVEAIAKVLPGNNGLPNEFNALPTDGMIPGSAQYTKQALFGLSELDDCVHAAYLDDAGSEYQAFVVLPTAAGGLESVWAEETSNWQQMDLDGVPVAFREVPYSGLLGVLRADDGLIGVANCADPDELASRLGLLWPR